MKCVVWMGMIIGMLAQSACSAEPIPWTLEGYTRHTWTSVTGANAQQYSPRHKLGASSLAVNPRTGLIYLCCEKYPVLLEFDLQQEQPTLIPIGIEADIDIEALSIHEDTAWLLDEDELLLYSFPLASPDRVTISKATQLGIDTGSIPENPLDLRSLEGLVVTATAVPGVTPLPADRPDPYFYLLDEQDHQNGTHTAKIYTALNENGTLKNHQPAVSFSMQDRYQRLTDLFLFNGSLHAIRSYYNPTDRTLQSYQIVRCNLEDGTLSEVLDFTPIAKAITPTGMSSNFEGATVTKEGRLLVVSDNESEVKRQGQDPQLSKLITALIEFAAQDPE